MNIHGGATSYISQTANTATAYAHRDKLLLFQFYDSVGGSGVWPEDGFSFLQGFRATITDSLEDGEWGMYANYPDTQVESDQAQRLYWLENLDRLKEIKAKWDPTEVFWDPQSVSPAT